MAIKHHQNHKNTLNVTEIARETMVAEGFHPDIPATVSTEVAQLDEATILDQASPKDMRNLLWSSIDNVTSQDLDQVEYVEQTEEGFSVLIGIADVCAFVHKGSATDSHAYQNTTSVYTGVTTFPMLPEELSHDKTSLLEDQDRLAMIIEITVANDGSVETKDVYQALVRNYAKMSYEVIGKWLDSDRQVPTEVSRVPGLQQQVQLQFEVAKRLRQARSRRGSLHLETIQASPVLDEQATIIDFSFDEPNSAREMIENFMVAANGAMADFLDRQGIVSLRRVVRTPENWPRIVDIASDLNETLPSNPDVHALADFLEHQRQVDPEHFADLSLAIVKLLGPGDYVVQKPGEESDGHFGLAVHRYTHSTAPNRRYPDLITQRLLKSCLDQQKSRYSVDELNVIADHCNDRESAARKVERKMRKVAAAMFMKDRVGEKFEGIVTGVSAKGTFARVIRPPVDGMVVKREQGLKVGQRVRLKLLSTEPEKGFIDFAAM